MQHNFSFSSSSRGPHPALSLPGSLLFRAHSSACLPQGTGRRPSRDRERGGDEPWPRGRAGPGEQGGTAQAGPRWGCAPRPALPPALALGWVPATASRGLPGTCQALCRQTGSLSPWCGWWGGDSKDQREEVKRLQSVTGRPGPLRLSGGSGPVLRS